MGQRRVLGAVQFLGPLPLSQGARGISADGVGFHGYEHRLELGRSGRRAALPIQARCGHEAQAVFATESLEVYGFGDHGSLAREYSTSRVASACSSNRNITVSRVAS